MQILPAGGDAFRPYGKILHGYDTAALLEKMDAIPMPEDGVNYEPGIPALESDPIFPELCARAFGGMPIQLGMCWGYNTRLNCLEYHRSSEINIAANDVVLLLARQEEIVDGKLDVSHVKAFFLPRGTAAEIYATTLHYAPCHTDRAAGFRVAVVLPRGTNTARPPLTARCEEDLWLTARNKWLLAHASSAEAAGGAHVGLIGENLDITKLSSGGEPNA